MRIRADDLEQTVTDALSLLVDDYERARTFLAILAESPERAGPLRERTLPELVKSLRVLLILEDEILDPAFLRACCTTNDVVIRSQARALRDTVARSLQQMQSRHPATAEFRALALVLRDLVELHVRSGQERIYPRARAIIARDELFAMAARMRARRAAIESSEGQSDLHGCLETTREAAEEASDWDEPDCCS